MCCFKYFLLLFGAVWCESILSELLNKAAVAAKVGVVAKDAAAIRSMNESRRGTVAALAPNKLIVELLHGIALAILAEGTGHLTHFFCRPLTSCTIESLMA
jgi:hypothetical protein